LHAGGQFACRLGECAAPGELIEQFRFEARQLDNPLIEACCSVLGLSCGSMRITTEAACKFRPVSPVSI
jgi:hypothetical protein